MAERATRECPYCQETIYAEALKCRWCGEMMPDAPRTAAAGGPGVGAGGPEVRKRPPARPGARPGARVHHREARHPEGASTILVFGILSWLFCIIFGALAWSKGNEYERQCKSLGLQPEGSATAGKMLGMIHCILTMVALGLIFFIALVGGLSGM